MKKTARPKYAEVEEITEGVKPVKQVAVQDGKMIEVEAPAETPKVEPKAPEVKEPEPVTEEKEEASVPDVPMVDEPEDKESILLPKDDEEPKKEEEKEVLDEVVVPDVPKDAPLAVESAGVESEKTKPDKKSFWIGLLLTIFVTALSFGIFFFVLRQSPQKSTVESEIAETPTPTEEVAELVREKVTFEVLNGSGVSGAAGKAGKALEEMGYTLGDTGNADEQEGNTLYLSEDLADYAETIIKDLVDYDIEKVTGEPLEGSSSARLILGK